VIDSIIKERLLSNKPLAYSLIIKHFEKELLELGATVFRTWLAKRMEVPEDIIHLSSLYSAINRLRKKQAKEKLKGKNFVAGEKKKIQEGFAFSSVDDSTKKSRAQEL
jgi:hypothetical protein